jgi:hypothetical protein
MPSEDKSLSLSLSQVEFDYFELERLMINFSSSSTPEGRRKKKKKMLNSTYRNVGCGSLAISSQFICRVFVSAVINTYF